VPVAVVAETPTPEPVVAPAAEVHRAEAVPPPLPPAAPAPKPPLRAPKPKVVKPGLEEKLREARHALAVGDYRRAAHDYTAVIKKKYQLDEVTSELELALDRNPKASDLWQALGDAYMRGDRLQDAISAYERGVAVA
jgi:tetratricopeptide (TPR) repeat protein